MEITKALIVKKEWLDKILIIWPFKKKNIEKDLSPEFIEWQRKREEDELKRKKEAYNKFMKPLKDYAKPCPFCGGSNIIFVYSTSDVINRFGSAREATRKTGVDFAKIGQVCLGKRKTTGGYKWRFADE